MKNFRFKTSDLLWIIPAVLSPFILFASDFHSQAIGGSARLGGIANDRFFVGTSPNSVEFTEVTSSQWYLNLWLERISIGYFFGGLLLTIGFVFVFGFLIPDILGRPRKLNTEVESRQ